MINISPMRAGGDEKTNDGGWGEGERKALFKASISTHSLRCNNCLLSTYHLETLDDHFFMLNIDSLAGSPGLHEG